MNETEKQINIAKFLDHLGKIIQIPSKNRAKKPVLQYAASKIEADAQYSEKGINEILKLWCVVDHIEMRRALIDMGYLCRTADGAKYWLADEIPQSWVWKEKEYA
ncbi:DUF2087 domain-containing protein [Eubacteriales bacterium OttesenSCG-928-K08]|nr:DUF2087 domain-containing protein [Eubacteriales bacterium OttesenSCG-928-K08]